MSNNSPNVETAERVDRLCDQFESAFRRGERPSIDAFLAIAPTSDRPHLLAALIGLECELRTSVGESPQLDDYRRLFPQDVSIVDASWEELRRSGGAGSGQITPSAAETMALQTSDTSVGPRPAPPASTQPPKTFARFEIIRQLGRGACGAVYLARDPKLERNVALKVPHGAVFMDESDQQRFIREAKAAAGLSHPNICRVYEVGEADGHDFIVMEYVEGKPLDDYIARGKVSMKQSAQVVRKLALALEDAHRQGIVHRDIKPSNVMINVRGEPIIMDFGLARIQRTMDAALTQSGMLIGSPAYMSPEQARGAVDEIGPAADIYSLGVVLYFLLCGQRPFSGTILEVIGRTLSDNPAPPPSRHRPDIPEALEAICMKAIAKQAKKRFASMKEFADALNQYLKGLSKEPATATNTFPATSPSKPSASSQAPTIYPWEDEQADQQFPDFPLERTPLIGGRSRTRIHRKSAAAGWMSRWTGNWVQIAAGLGFVSAVILGAIVYYVKTDKGTLVVEVADKEVEAKLTEHGLKVEDSATHRTYDITVDTVQQPRPGNYKVDPSSDLKLEVLSDEGLNVSTNEFQLVRGGKVRIRVYLETKSNAGPQTKSVANTAQQDEAITVITQLGGKIERDLNRPDQPVIFVNLNQTKVNDRGLEVLKNFPELERLYLVQCYDITDNSLKHLSGLVKLRELDFLYDPISDDGVAHLAALRELKVLGLADTRVADGSFEILKRLPSLERVGFDGTGVSDKGLEQAKAYPALIDLALQQCPKISDEGLEHLAAATKLQHVNLTDSAVTTAGVKKLSAALPKCQIVSSFATFGPKTATSITDRSAAEWVLSVNGQVVVAIDGTPGTVRIDRELPVQPFRVHSVLLGDLRRRPSPQIRDADLTRLKDLTALKVLDLAWEEGLQINGAGLAYVAGLRNLETLNLYYLPLHNDALPIIGRMTWLRNMRLDATAVTDAGLIHLENLAELRTLNIGFTQITGTGLRHISKLSKLELLQLYGTQVTDGDFANLAPLKNLLALNLQDTRVTDAGLSDLYDLKSLRALYVTKTKVTPNGVDKLHQALPQCRISWDGGVIEPKASNAQPVNAVPTEKPDGSSTATDRKAAEWLVKQNAHLNFISAKTGRPLPNLDPGGALPAEPFYLTGLDLWGKSFPPAEIDHLRGLEHLQVVVMHASKSVDDHALAVIGGIPSITRLSLGANPFKGERLSYLRALQDLQDLNISENPNIDDTSMRHVAALKKLTGLNVARTSISDEGVEILSKLPQLNGLGLSGTRISGTAIDYLAKVPNLTGLNAEWTKLGDADGPKLARLKSLAELRLTGAEIGDAGIDAISKMTELKALFLGETRVTDEGLKSLGKMSGLKHLVLVKCRAVSESGIAKLKAAIPECRIEWDGGVIEPNAPAKPNRPEKGTTADLEKAMAIVEQLGGKTEVDPNIPGKPVVAVFLGGKKLSNDGLAYLKGFVHLRRLDVNTNQITDAGIANLLDIPSLVDVNLASTPVTDASMEMLAKLPNLRYLNVAHTQVTDKGLETLKQCKLESLILSGLGITDAGLAHVGEMTTLKSLDLLWTKISDAGLKHVGKLTRLEFLTLYETNVGDDGVKDLAGLTNLSTHLALNGTKVTDKSIDVLSRFTKLQFIYLSNTKFSDEGIKRLQKALPRTKVSK